MANGNTSEASASTSLADRPPTPLWWRLALAGLVLVLTLTALLAQEALGTRGQALLGVFCFILVVAVFSKNLRAVHWRTIIMGFLLQLGLALLVLRVEAGYQAFEQAGVAITTFLDFTAAGTTVVFGKLADPRAMTPVFGPKSVPFAFGALPTIIFVSSFFSVLYYLGVLQFVVKILARVMMYLMGTSGAETLSATANVFMGQTEAPLIVKPYIARMTESELLALMVGGMATISGGMMAVYIGLGADPVAILATSVMAAPCGLYLSKLLLPETEEPLTRGQVKIEPVSTHRNLIDAAAAGASDGLWLALNVAAMLIAFLAILAFINHMLGLVDKELSLEKIFSYVFYPVALLLGVERADVPKVADLLGIKLAANEFVAFLRLTSADPATSVGITSGSRSAILATYALTGFANFASVGIQLGGIGLMAPERRPDLARLGMRALFVGYVATLVNAALVGLLI